MQGLVCSRSYWTEGLEPELLLEGLFLRNFKQCGKHQVQSELCFLLSHFLEFPVELFQVDLGMFMLLFNREDN